MRIQRILLCALSTLLLSTAVKAHWQGHWLFGISGGYVREDSEMNIEMKYTDPAPPIVARSDLSITMRDHAWLKGLLFGYATTCRDWLLGAELHMDFDNSDDDHVLVFADLSNPIFGNFISWNTKANLERQPTIGLTARWGYAMAPYFLPYFRFGAQTSEEKFEVTFNTDPLLSTSAITLRDQRRQVHWLAGLGMEMPIPCSQISARLEYNYLFPDHTLEDQKMLIAPAAKNPLFESEISPRTHIAKISLVWNFN